MKTYKIVRFQEDCFNSAVVKQKGLSFKEAQDHCKSKKSSGDGWFDGFEEEGKTDNHIRMSNRLKSLNKASDIL